MTDHVQPNWAGAPDWAKFWAVDSDGGAYWYRSQPTYDRKYGGWMRPLNYDEPDVSFDDCWPPNESDNWDIDWEQTLRSRP
jgi:hypothetical protein